MSQPALVLLVLIALMASVPAAAAAQTGPADSSRIAAASRAFSE